MVEADETLKQQIDQEPVAEVCEASLEAARGMTGELLGSLGDTDSVLYRVAGDRNSRIESPTERLGIVPALLYDPSRSPIVVARYRQQEGRLPEDVSIDDPDAMLALWSARKADIPALKVPEGHEDSTMALADRLGMRGARYQTEQGVPNPVIFERGEVADMTVTPDTRKLIASGARNANRERIKTALAVEEAHPSHLPIIASADPLRTLRADEREVVKGFAPNATNEFELFVASAVDQGFAPAESNIYGSTYLPDGSSYITMRHESGKEMIVLAPAPNKTEDGRKQTGVYNTYKALIDHGNKIHGINGTAPSEGFVFEGSDMLYITSTHYGTMGIMNNLHAVHELRTNVSSFRVVGDNQPARAPQAHLIEIGHTLGSLERAAQIPALRAGLLGEAEAA